MSKLVSAARAASLIEDGMVVSVSSSSGLGCPDAVLAAIGERFDAEGHPKNITTLHPIAAGDMYGIRGIDHLAKPGLLKRTLCGSYPSGPSSSEPPQIWKMIGDNSVAAYNVPSGILFDMHREAAAKRPGVLTKVGLDTFADPRHQGCAMNAAASEPIVSVQQFDGEEWLYFRSIVPDVSIIRATTADERGNLTYEHEGAYLGGLEQALAARNNGGIVIAQVKRVVENGTLKPHDVRVPGVLVDHIVVAPDQLQTTLTPYDPAISGEIFRPLSTFRNAEMSVQKVIARRVAMELADGMAVNIGFGISANVPRILLEEGQHGKVTWVIEQGAVGGVPLLDFKFGCASNADAFMPSPHQFIYFQGGGFDASLLSFLQIDRHGSVNVSKLSAQAACHRRRRRLCRHHRAGEEDRLLRLLQCRRQAVAGRWRHPHRRGRQGQEGGRRGRAHLLLGQARGRARTGHHLCHRALRHEADAGWADGDGAGTGHRPRARRAGAGRDPARRRQRPEGHAGRALP